MTSALQHTGAMHFSGLRPISIAALQVMGDPGCDLYMETAERGPVLYRSATSGLECDYDDLNVRGVEYLFMLGDDMMQFMSRLKGISGDSLSDNEFLACATAVQTAAAAELEAASHRHDISAMVQASQGAAALVVSLVDRMPILPSQLFGMLDHDYFTFHHSINVSTYCVLLATKLGMAEGDRLQEIAVGALLHDVGKRGIPRSVLLKPGRLNREERDLIESHPVAGYQMLSATPDLTLSQLMMVYQHHEKLDGSGYPVGITGAEIDPWAMLCSVVDIFDAVTSNRPYRKPLTIENALSVLATLAGTGLDTEMVECWKQIMLER